VGESCHECHHDDHADDAGCDELEVVGVAGDDAFEFGLVRGDHGAGGAVGDVVGDVEGVGGGLGAHHADDLAHDAFHGGGELWVGLVDDDGDVALFAALEVGGEVFGDDDAAVDGVVLELFLDVVEAGGGGDFHHVGVVVDHFELCDEGGALCAGVLVGEGNGGVFDGGAGGEDEADHDHHEEGHEDEHDEADFAAAEFYEVFPADPEAVFEDVSFGHRGLSPFVFLSYACGCASSAGAVAAASAVVDGFGDFFSDLASGEVEEDVFEAGFDVAD